MLNKCVFIGRLVRDVELRYTPTGKAVANFTIAVDRSRGEDKQTDYIDIVTWEKQAETCAQYIGKGRLVAVVGRLQIRSYEANDGSKRKAAEVVAQEVRFLDRPGGQQEQQAPGSGDSPVDDDAPF